MSTNYLSLQAAEGTVGALSRLPRCLKVLAEGVLYRLPIEQALPQIGALLTRDQSVPISFVPGRALLQDFMGIPLMTDMASMREMLSLRGIDPKGLDPVIPVDFVVDHSLTVLHAGGPESMQINRSLEMERNRERFSFIKWCQGSFGNFRVIPPGRGIMHQVNLEWLSQVVTNQKTAEGGRLVRPDTMIGTDSHTTMVNALGVLGWGVGGIEAEMAMLGMPLEITVPEVVGVKLVGGMRAGVTATDLVLHIAQMLRKVGVVGSFVEFHGEGVARLPLADRATIANMSPEFGATCTYFPIDELTIDYLRMTGRSESHLRMIEAYARAQGLWQDGAEAELEYDRMLEFDLSQVEPSMAGPVRPEDRVGLPAVPASFRERMEKLGIRKTAHGDGSALSHGSIVIAAITSCTNTSNPAVMMAAGLLARNAAARGLRPRPWVKTSLAPGSRVVSDYLAAAGLTPHLETLGFHTVGYGCATCNGNSGPLDEAVRQRIDEGGLCTVAVLSGNRNFEGRIHPQIQAAYLASPPLVIAAAIAGSIEVDLSQDALGNDYSGRPVYLADIWPEEEEIRRHISLHVTGETFSASYANGMETTSSWAALQAPRGALFDWDPNSLVIQPSPFPAMGPVADVHERIAGLRPLLVLGDGITTDHISPNGSIHPDSPAGSYLQSKGTSGGKLGNFGARRGNAEVCVRGMFDNPLLVNELTGGERGNRTRVAGSEDRLSVYDAAERYRTIGCGMLVVAGRNYGAGSSRDWAARGLRMLGVVAVLAESFERIHRSNLVGMGVLPLAFPADIDRRHLALAGTETFDLDFPPEGPTPNGSVRVTVSGQGRQALVFNVRLKAVSNTEIELIRIGGILPSIISASSQATK